MTGRQIQEFLRKAYCRVDYDNFCKFLDNDKLPSYFTESFLEQKWRKYQNDFLSFFCELDNSEADRFFEFVNKLD